MKREDIVREVEKRLWDVTTAGGYGLDLAEVLRNPAEEVRRFPCVCLFEMDDEVVDGGNKGQRHAALSYNRRLRLILECWRQAGSDAAAGQEAVELYDAVRKSLFRDAGLLNGLARLTETKVSRVMKPPFGERTVGMALFLQAAYVDVVAP